MNQLVTQGTFQKELEKYRNNKFNVMVPAVVFDDPTSIWEPVLTVAEIDTNPEAKEIYPGQADNKFRMHGVALNKLANCAGIVFENTQDPIKKLLPGLYCAYQTIGYRRQHDGSYTAYTATYALDLKVKEEEIRDAHTAKIAKKYKDKNKEWQRARVEYMTNRDLVQLRKYLVQLAESGSRNRVIRGILGLKSEYTLAELKKPFVVVNWRLKIDMSDPETKRLVTLKALEAQASTSGPVRAPSISNPTPPIDLPPEADEDVTPTDFEADDTPEDLGPPTPQEEFEARPRPVKLQIIKELVAKKGYDMSKQPVPPDKWTDGRLNAFFSHLSELKDKKK